MQVCAPHSVACETQRPTRRTHVPNPVTFEAVGSWPKLWTSPAGLRWAIASRAQHTFCISQVLHAATKQRKDKNTQTHGQRERERQRDTIFRSLLGNFCEVHGVVMLNFSGESALSH